MYVCVGSRVCWLCCPSPLATIQYVVCVDPAGADITDYFNYGFNEELWKLFCEKQRRMKVEVGQLSRNVSIPLRMPPLHTRDLVVNWPSDTAGTCVLSYTLVH